MVKTRISKQKQMGKVRKKREYHGMKDTPLYLVWASMVNRTTNHSNSRYKYYGERGIKVCNKWKSSFEEFCYWALSNGYDNGYAIRRKDVNGDFCPKNCEVVLKKESNKHSRLNKKTTINGVTLNRTEWAKKLGINYQTINRRLKNGWTIEKSLTTKSGETQKHWFLLNGKKVSFSELCRKTNFCMANYYYRRSVGKTEIKDLFKGVNFKKYKIEEV